MDDKKSLEISYENNTLLMNSAKWIYDQLSHLVYNFYNAHECFPISFSSKCHGLKPAKGTKTNSGFESQNMSVDF